MTNPTPTQPDWKSEFREKFYVQFDMDNTFKEAIDFIQSVADTSRKRGIAEASEFDEFLKKEAVDTFRKRVDEELEKMKDIVVHCDGIQALEEAQKKVREL